MAKLSIVKRNEKNIELHKKYKQIRAQYKQQLKDIRSGKLDRKKTISIVLKMDKLPKNSSKTRTRNRCLMTGRARGIVHYKYFGMYGFQIREKANLGRILGLVKV